MTDDAASAASVASGPASGPGVLLVHGIGVSGRYFAPLARDLSGTHRVVVPDLPGFGRSPRPRPAPGITDQAAAMERVLERSGLRHPVLVGHSMGSQVVTEVAARNPGRFRGLVLIGPVVDPTAATALRQAWRLARDVTREPWNLNALVLRDYLRGGPRSFFGSLGHMLDYDLAGRLSGVTAPVVLIRGSHDPIAPRAFLERLAAGTGGAEVVEVPAARHLAMTVRPDLVADAVRRFP